jgi:hypothetical protein
MKNKCQHQFFKISKLSKYSKFLEESQRKLKKECALAYGKGVSPCICNNMGVSVPDIHGVRVICVLCELQKDLYEKEVE